MSLLTRVCIGEGTTWPLNNGLEWALRHSAPSRETSLQAASVVAAYRRLIDMPEDEAISALRALRAARGDR